MPRDQVRREQRGLLIVIRNPASWFPSHLPRGPEREGRGCIGVSAGGFGVQFCCRVADDRYMHRDLSYPAKLPSMWSSQADASLSLCWADNSLWQIVWFVLVGWALCLASWSDPTHPMQMRIATANSNCILLIGKSVNPIAPQLNLPMPLSHIAQHIHLSQWTPCCFMPRPAYAICAMIKYHIIRTCPICRHSYSYWFIKFNIFVIHTPSTWG